MGTFMKSNIRFSTPPGGASRQAPARQLYRSDFGLGNTPNLVGQQTAAIEGAKIGVYEGTDNGLAISSSKVVRGAATGVGFIGLKAQGVGGSFEMKIDAMPTAGGIYFDLFRNALGGSPDSYRLELGDTGLARMATRISGTLTYVGQPFNVAAGDTVEIRYVGGLLNAYKNGVLVSSAAVSGVALSGWHGIAWTSPAAGFQLSTCRVGTY